MIDVSKGSIMRTRISVGAWAKTTLLCGCLIGFSFAAESQSFCVTLSPKHVTKIDEVKSGASKLKYYRRYFSKDSAKQVEALNKNAKHSGIVCPPDGL
jgi:hypothetical protein